ncbi:hypothetical protein CK507_02570 [Pseudomonas sp. WN033]|nr:hypothetical protein CK507_02570 [Pseudomonas sp. WN033]
MSVLFWSAIVGLVLIAFYAFRKWNMRPVEWEPEEVVALLDSWINDDIDYRGWDYFEACEIADPKLEAVRQRAIEATYLDSPYIQSCGQPGERLNEQGKELFKELKTQCL